MYKIMKTNTKIKNETTQKRETPQEVQAMIDQYLLHTTLTKLFLLLSIPTYIFTRYIIIAPFGRHVPPKNQYSWWLGPQLNARMSWFVFESPNLIWALYYFHAVTAWCVPSSSSSFRGTSTANCSGGISTNAILMSLFTLHYLHRDILYPLCMNKNSQKVPFLVTISASFITAWNGYLQLFYLANIRKEVILSFSLENIPIWTGMVLFFLGMGINIHSDGVLRNLRQSHRQIMDKLSSSSSSLDMPSQEKEGMDGPSPRYYIPHSFWFTYISCPNFFGELLEWFGFAMASHFSLPSVAFFVYTASNLLPRGMAHHQWYQLKFENYPKERKWAVIPLIL